jgi:hypothetical protein
MIRRRANHPVEFAGHYTVPVWNCGSACWDFVIVDSITGRVYETFIDVILLNDESIKALEYRPDSRLLKVNGCVNEENCGYYDYEMVDGKGLRLVRKEILPDQP